MEIQRLEEFIVIAQCAGIKKAAEQLQLSAATLASRLAAFEKSLDTVLFYRSSQKMTLTEAGQLFYIDAQEIVSHYHSLRQDMQSIAQARKYQSIRIAIVGSGLPFYLGPFLDIVNRQYPDIQLDILDDSYCSIQEGLLSGDVDLYFAPVMSHIVYEGIVRYPLSSAQHCLTLPAVHPLAQNPSISLRELDHERFIIYPATQEPCIREFQLENLKAAGIHFSIYETSSSPAFYKLLVPIGKGLLLQPEMPTMGGVSGIPNTVSLPVKDLTYSAPSSLFYRKENARQEVLRFVEDFIRFAKEIAVNEHRKTL